MARKNLDNSGHYFDLKGKNAEQFVHELAVKTFLTDWCFPNPILPNGKELCDLLVVFDRSYGWDHIINRAHEESKRYEIIARELARPNRFERRVLAKTIVHHKFAAHRNKTHDIYRSMFRAPTVTYCFLFCAEHIPRRGRRLMLQAMCYVARGIFRENQKVIGIATEKEISPISSYDFVLLYLPSWTSEDERKVEKLKQELGIFQNPSLRQIEEAEYPDLVDDVNS